MILFEFWSRHATSKPVEVGTVTISGFRPYWDERALGDKLSASIS